MEWVVVGVVVVIALVGLVIIRRRALEAERHAREATSGRDDDTTGERD
jgi:hypothetical protein